MLKDILERQNAKRKQHKHALFSSTSKIHNSILSENNHAQTYSSFRKKNNNQAPFLPHSLKTYCLNRNSQNPDPSFTDGHNMSINDSVAVKLKSSHSNKEVLNASNLLPDDFSLSQYETLRKKRGYLDDLKQKLMDLVNNNHGFASGLQLYLKKSSLMAGLALEPGVACKMMELEASLLRVFLTAVSRWNEPKKQQSRTLSQNDIPKLPSAQSIKKQVFRLNQQIKMLQEENIQLKSTASLKTRKEQEKTTTDSKSNFLKFKMLQEQKMIEQMTEKAAPKGTDSEEQEKLQAEVERLRKSINTLEAQKLKLMQNVELKSLQLKGMMVNNSKLDASLHEARTEILIKNSKIAALEEKNEKLEGASHYQELWRMASEEIEQLRNMRIELENDLKKANRKYKIVKEKLNSYMERKTIEIPQDAGNEKDELCKMIEEVKHWKGMARLALKPFEPESVEKLLSENIVKPALEEKLEKMKLALPGFYVFLESHEERIQYELKHLSSKSINPDFFLKIRAIMDSKFNEFWSTNSSKEWKKFPDFVIGFLEKFDISKEFKKVQLNTSPSETTESNKVSFFLDVFNPKLKGVWECDLFKSFLLESYSEDELFFYLSCRNLLFKGACLEIGLGNADPIIYIQLQRALKVTEVVLSKYERGIVEKIKFGVQLKKKKRNRRYYIDAHFLLKVFLEIYSCERTKRYQYYQAALGALETSTRVGGSKYINYKNFKKFIASNYSFMTASEIAEMFRECYNLSDGQVNYQVIFAVASRGLFVRQLKFNPILPAYNMDSFDCPEMLQLQDELRKGKYFLKGMYQLGLERVVMDYDRFRKQTYITPEHPATLDGLMNVVYLAGWVPLLASLEKMRTFDQPSCGPQCDTILMRNVENQVDLLKKAASMNAHKELWRKTLKQAAIKLASIFKLRVNEVYKYFGKDINRKLVELSK